MRVNISFFFEHSASNFLAKRYSSKPSTWEAQPRTSVKVRARWARHALQRAHIAPGPLPMCPDGLPESPYLLIAFCQKVLVRRNTGMLEKVQKNHKRNSTDVCAVFYSS